MTLRENQIDEPVTSVMTKGVLYIEAEESLNEAVKIIADFDVGSLIVTEQTKPVGIITTKDIVRALSKKLDFDKVKIREITQSPLITISAYETVSIALLKMKEKRINHL
ncbi:MAG: CBS domain-containing protein, partial [Candidatus Heimdallarchaeaceae archaeon]